MEDDLFEPRLGRMRAGGGKRGRKYLHRLLAAAALAGGPRRASTGRFDGSRIGRGAAMGRLLGSRDRHAAFRSRRAVVKARLVRLGGGARTAAAAHLRYIQRDGVQRDGAPGVLYSATGDRADGRAFLERCDGDRHQFRFIVSAEDGAQYDDLKPLTRRLMAQIEKDLGTRLDWVAVDHLDTGHPHTHIMLRGKDEFGQNLVIAREYISRGMRERAAELVTLDLGPRTDLEIEKRLRAEIGAERLTSIDRRLMRDLEEGRQLAAGHRDPFQHALRAGRLKKLEALGLAEHLGGGRWRLAGDIEHRLRQLSERGDIVRTMQRALAAARLERGPSDRVIHEAKLAEPVTGRVIGRGLADEAADRHYLLVDGVDGRAHRIELGCGEAVEPLPVGAIVTLEPNVAATKDVDRTVADIAARNGGRYSTALHLLDDPGASGEFVQAHVRRLEAIRRAVGGAERLEDGEWRIPVDHLERVEAFERRRLRDRPVRVRLLSPLPIERLSRAGGATWLDRQLLSEQPEPLRDGGFGREVRGALSARRQWLLDEQLAHEESGETRYRRGLLAILQRRELLRVSGEVGAELHAPFAPAGAGMRIVGTLERRVDLASGRFALIVNPREFTLVPWRDDMARHLGREIHGRVGASGISWSIGRGRTGPEIG